jgi:hypothetical protein
MPSAPDSHSPPLPEWAIHAEHRAALDATLFAPAKPDVVLELREGELAKARAARE